MLTQPEMAAASTGLPTRAKSARSRARYHKYSHIVGNASWRRGFRRMEQEHLAAAAAPRGSLKKMQGLLDLPGAVASRVGATACGARVSQPHRCGATAGSFAAAAGRSRWSLSLNPDWAARHPMTLSGLESGIGEWRTLGITLESEPEPLVALPA